MRKVLLAAMIAMAPIAASPSVALAQESILPMPAADPMMSEADKANPALAFVYQSCAEQSFAAGISNAIKERSSNPAIKEFATRTSAVEVWPLRIEALAAARGSDNVQAACPGPGRVAEKKIRAFAAMSEPEATAIYPAAEGQVLGHLIVLATIYAANGDNEALKAVALKWKRQYEEQVSELQQIAMPE